MDRYINIDRCISVYKYVCIQIHTYIHTHIRCTVFTEYRSVLHTVIELVCSAVLSGLVRQLLADACASFPQSQPSDEETKRECAERSRHSAYARTGARRECR